MGTIFMVEVVLKNEALTATSWPQRLWNLEMHCPTLAVIRISPSQYITKSMPAHPGLLLVGRLIEKCSRHEVRLTS